MPIDETADIEEARRWFAEELRHTAHVRSAPVVEAFATVPREHFAGPGPWRVLSPIGGPDYWTTHDADPRRLCHDVLVAIDETRRLNNGQPSLWAARFDQLGLAAGDRVIHVGAGLGYYSAIIAEIVGLTGEVTAIEIDPALAERARANLARSWPQAKVIATDGFAFRADEPVDAIVVNAGVSHLALPWLDSLKGDGGRLLVPLTNANLWGAFFVIECWGARYPVHCASWALSVAPAVETLRPRRDWRRRWRAPTTLPSSPCAALPKSRTIHVGLPARAGSFRPRPREMRRGISSRRSDL
jgi:protein-L-isoaspartate(D-aspartate) O-methyltransferase